MSQTKLAAILSLLFLVIFAVMTIVLMHKKRNRQTQPTHGTPHGAGGHAAGHGGAHAHQAPKAGLILQYLLGGPTVWFYWDHAGNAKKFWPLILLALIFLAEMFFWRNIGTPFQYIFWGILTATCVTFAVLGREGANPAHWHLEPHYIDRQIEWIIEAVINWGIIIGVSVLALYVANSSIENNHAETEAKTKIQVAKTKATAWVWEHKSPLVKNRQTKVSVWEEGSSGKLVFTSTVTNGAVVTINYSAGSDEGTYEESTGEKGVVKPLGHLKSAIPTFEGKTQVISFLLFDEGESVGVITLTPIELKWEHRKGTH